MHRGFLESFLCSDILHSMKNIKETLSNDLMMAMAQKDTVSINAIRTLRGRIDNAEAPMVPEPTSLRMAGGIAGASSDSSETEVPRKELSETEIRKIIEAEIEDTQHMLEILRTSSLPDTEQLADQVIVLKGYL